MKSYCEKCNTLTKHILIGGGHRCNHCGTIDPKLKELSIKSTHIKIKGESDDEI